MMKNKMIFSALFCAMLSGSNAVLGMDPVGGSVSQQIPKPVKLVLSGEQGLLNYAILDCSLPDKSEKKGVPATIGIRPSDGSRQLEIVPRAKPNKQGQGCWKYNQYALKLNADMLSSIDSRIQSLRENNPQCEKCVIFIAQEYPGQNRSLFYEIEIENYINEAKRLMDREEAWKKKIAEDTKREETERIAKEESLRKKPQSSSFSLTLPVGSFAKIMAFAVFCCYALYRWDKLLPERMMHFFDAHLPIRFLR